MEKLACTILLLLHTSLWHAFTLPVCIDGHLKKNPKNPAIKVAGLKVFVKGNGKVLASTTTDAKGNFYLTFTPDKEKSFDFYCARVGVDTFFLKSVTYFESDAPDMTFVIPGKSITNDE